MYSEECIISVVSYTISKSLLISTCISEEWDTCIPESGECGMGRQSTIKLVLLGGSRLGRKTRLCDIPCSGVEDELPEPGHLIQSIGIIVGRYFN